MLKELVSANDDIRRLVAKGYAVAFDSNYLIIRDVPYLDSAKDLQWGAIVSNVVFVDQDHIKQKDHQILFAGSVPHNLDGSPIPNLAGGPTTLALSPNGADVIVQRSFSNKPRSGAFQDFFGKIESYVAIISGPAMELYDANPYTFRSVLEEGQNSVFKFNDTLTSLAEITDLSAKFAEDVIAVIGLGGTGSYVLDFLVKTPVREIRAFDPDWFHVHNAFRSPGRLDSSELGKTKATVYQGRYENFRHGLSVEPKFIDRSDEAAMQGVTFAFVCVDKGSSRAAIFDLLIAQRIPFIDAGMGLDRKRGPINGMLRMTHYSAESAQQTRDKGYDPLADRPDDVYRTTIQISELNALNASLAVVRFKQLRGFYYQEVSDVNHLFEIRDLKIAGGE